MYLQIWDWTYNIPYCTIPNFWFQAYIGSNKLNLLYPSRNDAHIKFYTTISRRTKRIDEIINNNYTDLEYTLFNPQNFDFKPIKVVKITTY